VAILLPGTESVGIERMEGYVNTRPDPESREAVLIRRHERTGRPLGEEGFVSRLESMLGRVFHPLKPGRKRKEK
jgi:hypothetical protein